MWQSYKQERDCLVHFVRLVNRLIRDEESARDNHVLACNVAKYSPIKNFSTHSRLSSKLFLIWLLTTPPHLKCVATLPCSLSLMAYFAGINVSQGNVATHARCRGIFNTCLTANLPGNLLVNFFNRLRFNRIVAKSLWPSFFSPLCRLLWVTSLQIYH